MARMAAWREVKSRKVRVLSLNRVYLKLVHEGITVSLKGSQYETFVAEFFYTIQASMGDDLGTRK